jgi:hypothetical protein
MQRGPELSDGLAQALEVDILTLHDDARGFRLFVDLNHGELDAVVRPLLGQTLAELQGIGAVGLEHIEYHAFDVGHV